MMEKIMTGLHLKSSNYMVEDDLGSMCYTASCGMKCVVHTQTNTQARVEIQYHKINYSCMC